MPDLDPAVRRVAEAMPSRWAFEGLLLLEADRRLPPEESEPNPNRDLSEDVFPVESERMGVTADAMALGFMLIGLMAVTAFLSWGANRHSAPRRMKAEGENGSNTFTTESQSTQRQFNRVMIP